MEEKESFKGIQEQNYGRTDHNEQSFIEDSILIKCLIEYEANSRLKKISEELISSPNYACTSKQSSQDSFESILSFSVSGHDSSVNESIKNRKLTDFLKKTSEEEEVTREKKTVEISTISSSDLVSIESRNNFKESTPKTSKPNQKQVRFAIDSGVSNCKTSLLETLIDESSILKNNESDEETSYLRGMDLLKSSSEEDD